MLFLKRLQSPVLLCAAGVFCLLSLGVLGVEITRIDVRFALMVEDMARYGIGVFPTVNGVEYADYPSAYPFFSYLTTLGGRWVSYWSLTLPTLLLGAYIIGMTFLIGERIQKNLGFVAMALSLMTMEYLYIFMSFCLDVPLAAAAVTMLYLLQIRKMDFRTLGAFAALLVFCFVMRGILGIVLLGAAVGGYLIATRQWKRVLIYGVTGAAVGIICCATGVWLIFHQGGEELWLVFLDWQIASRMTESNYIYYFTDGIGSFAPMTLLAVAGLVLARKRLFSSPLVGWLGFILLPLVLLSIPGCKHLRYMLLTLPVFALLGAYGLLNAPAERWGKWLRLLWLTLDRAVRWLFCPGVAVLMIVGFCLAPAGWLPWGHWVVALVLWWVIFRYLRNRDDWRMRLLRASMLIAVFLVVALGPFLAIRENSADFVSGVEARREGKLYLFRMGPDHDDLKYVLHTAKERRSEIVYVFDEDEERFPINDQLTRMYPYFSAEELLPRANENDIIVLRKKDLKRLQPLADAAGRAIVTIHSGDLGHRECVAVKLVRPAK